MLCPYLNRLVSLSWSTSNGIAQKRKLRGSWTSYTAPIAKGLLRTWCCWVSKTLIVKGSIQNLTWLSTTNSISKGFYLEHDAVKYNKDSKPQHDLILGTKPWKSWYRNGLLKPNNNRWCDHIANDNINHLRDSSKLCFQKLNDSLAKEPISTHAKSAAWMLSTKSRSPVNCQTRLQASKCKPS